MAGLGLPVGSDESEEVLYMQASLTLGVHAQRGLQGVIYNMKQFTSFVTDLYIVEVYDLVVSDKSNLDWGATLIR